VFDYTTSEAINIAGLSSSILYRGDSEKLRQTHKDNGAPAVNLNNMVSFVVENYATVEESLDAHVAGKWQIAWAETMHVEGDKIHGQYQGVDKKVSCISAKRYEKPQRREDMKRIVTSLLVMTFCFSVSEIAAEKTADKKVIADFVCTNGKIDTVNEKQPWAEAVVAKGNKIVYVGDNTGAGAFVFDLNMYRPCPSGPHRPRSGKPTKKNVGPRISAPAPEELRQDPDIPWQQVKAFGAGHVHTFRVKTMGLLL